MPDRKPLELVVYGDHQPGPDGWRILAEPSKRLTDPELAAEVHQSIGDVYRAKIHGKDDTDPLGRYITLTRFATHPHHDVEESL